MTELLRCYSDLGHCFSAHTRPALPSLLACLPFEFSFSSLCGSTAPSVQQQQQQQSLQNISPVP